MQTLLLIIHILACTALILIVLLQKGRGAEMGAAFGGASQTLFGSTGGTTFMGKLTTMAAVVFMLTSLGLTYFSGRPASVSIMRDAQAPAGPSLPQATPVGPPTATQAPQPEPGTAANPAEEESSSAAPSSQPAETGATVGEPSPQPAQREATDTTPSNPAGSEKAVPPVEQQPAQQSPAAPSSEAPAAEEAPAGAGPETTAPEPAQAPAPVEGQGSAAPPETEQTTSTTSNP